MDTRGFSIELPQQHTQTKSTENPGCSTARTFDAHDRNWVNVTIISFCRCWQIVVNARKNCHWSVASADRYMGWKVACSETWNISPKGVHQLGWFARCLSIEWAQRRYHICGWVHCRTRRLDSTGSSARRAMNG
jgi:hypothetical protein